MRRVLLVMETTYTMFFGTNTGELEWFFGGECDVLSREWWSVGGAGSRVSSVCPESVRCGTG